MMAQRPLPKLAPGLVDPASMAGDQATIQTRAVLDQLNAAIANSDFKALEQCFYAEQAYWRDQVALTYHIRTFRTPGVIASSLLETTKLRQLTTEGIRVDGSAAFIPVTPLLSAIIIGSANTAFDIIEDCHAAGLETTMNARSPTYILPFEYICQTLAGYEIDVDAADKRISSLPSFVDAQIARGVYANLASKQPDRYTALEAAGFQVMDSRHPSVVLLHNLLERAGGHYIDVGGTKIIEEGKVGIKAGVEPVAYTETGLLFSDGSRVETDAVIWCTGFSDTNALKTAAEILGGSVKDGSVQKNDLDDGPHILGPHDIATRLDATWGVDDEGEIRGMWKRHLNLDNFWIMGGFAQPQRWHSRNLALQIKAAVEGVLPPAYRDTPLPMNL
ncbi:monooxygenase [Penicillium herquei]|nr:monooxygenase [Penicillium herquei]